MHHRHTPQQITQLEAFFKECPHPNENQRRRLGRELGLDTKQIKFWFQNKRTQAKTQSERADNAMLRAENERMQCENIAFREALKDMICPSCGGPPFGEDDLGRHIQKLQQENLQLKQEYEKVSNVLAMCIGRPVSSEPESSSDPSSEDGSLPASLSSGNSLALESTGSPITGFDRDLDLGSAVTVSDENMLPSIMGEVTDVEKDMMVEAAHNAMDELLKLMPIDEPLWMKTSAIGGQAVLHRETYEKLSPRANNIRSSHARREATKDSRIVWMNAVNLIHMFLDPVKWLNLFPTIVRKAEVVEVVDEGASGNRSGAIQLMYEEMHIVSPLVGAREFCFIRYCQQINPGVWAMADVSFDSLIDNIPISRNWKFPSGCIIHDLPNGFSKVTWIEHVEVDDQGHTHRMFRDLIGRNLAYGAERWVITLQRMVERLVFSLDANVPIEEARDVISAGNGRRTTMEIANRMVRDFCEVLNVSRKQFPDLCEARNSGIRVSARRSREQGEPEGLVVTACTSLWLPVLHQTIFEFLCDDASRAQWDVLAVGNSRIHEFAHISNGTYPANCIRLIQPVIPDGRGVVTLQETSTDPLGSMLVYAPIDLNMTNMCARGLMDPSRVPLLSSGFMISSDGAGRRHPNPLFFAGESSSSSSSEGGSLSFATLLGGSLLTVAFQILVDKNDTGRDLHVRTVSTINSLITTAVDNIKDAFNCAGLD